MCCVCELLVHHYIIIQYGKLSLAESYWLMLSSAYRVFIGDLLGELKSKSFCNDVLCSLSAEKTAILCLSVKNDIPVLYVCGQIVADSSLTPLSGFWSMELSEDVITKHVRKPSSEQIY
jgi:hypothetical protein